MCLLFMYERLSNLVSKRKLIIVMHTGNQRFFTGIKCHNAGFAIDILQNTTEHPMEYQATGKIKRRCPVLLAFCSGCNFLIPWRWCENDVRSFMRKSYAHAKKILIQASFSCKTLPFSTVFVV